MDGFFPRPELERLLGLTRATADDMPPVIVSCRDAVTRQAVVERLQELWYGRAQHNSAQSDPSARYASYPTHVVLRVSGKGSGESLVDDIASLSSSMHIGDTKHRFWILDAHALGRHAQTRLKTLMEHRAGSCSFFLTTESPDRVLAALKDRCCLINANPCPQLVRQRLLQKHSPAVVERAMSDPRSREGPAAAQMLAEACSDSDTGELPPDMLLGFCKNMVGGLPSCQDVVKVASAIRKFSKTMAVYAVPYQTVIAKLLQALDDDGARADLLREAAEIDGTLVACGTSLSGLCGGDMLNGPRHVIVALETLLWKFYRRSSSNGKSQMPVGPGPGTL